MEWFILAILSALFAALFLGEQVTLRTAVAGVFVFVGLLLFAVKLD